MTRKSKPQTVMSLDGLGGARAAPRQQLSGLYPKYVLHDRGGSLDIADSLPEARRKAKRMLEWWHGSGGSICITEVVSPGVKRKMGCVRNRTKTARNTAAPRRR